MFNKILGGQLISVDERTARQNSFAMLDALEALDELKPLNCKVLRLYIEPDWRSAHKSNRDIEFYRGSLHAALRGDSGFKKSYDEYNTETWYLVFAVRKVVTENNHDLHTIDSAVVYAVGSEINSFNFSHYAKQIQDEDENARRGGKYYPARVLVAAYKPDRVVRVFAKDIYATLELAVRTMIEDIESSLSNEELAALINRKKADARSRSRRSMLEFAPLDSAVNLKG